MTPGAPAAARFWAIIAGPISRTKRGIPPQVSGMPRSTSGMRNRASSLTIRRSQADASTTPPPTWRRGADPRDQLARLLAGENLLLTALSVVPGLAIAAWLLLRNGHNIADVARQFMSETQLRFFFNYLSNVYAWSCILTLLGFGQRFLNRESPLLRYLTSAIFCYYVLHQTITVIAGYYLTEFQLGAPVESVLVLAITLAGCVFGYELIRRTPKIGIFFGVHKISGFRPNR